MSDQNKSLILAAARDLLENRESSTAYRALITHLYDAIERGVSAALSTYDADAARTLRDGYFAQFAERRLSHRDFLTGLVAAESNPVGYAKTSAFNFVRSEIRKSPPMLAVRVDEFDGDDWGSGGAEVAAAERDVLAEAEQHQSHRQWLADISIDDQLLLRLMYVEAAELPQASLELIAGRRGVDVAVVEAEVEARASAQSEARRKIQQELDSHIERIARVQDRILRVRAAMLDRGDRDVPPEIPPLNPERRNAIASSQRELLAATPDERRAFLDYLESKAESLGTGLRDARKRLQVEFPAQPRYEEVLAILGQLPAEPAKQKVAADTLRKRFTRLRTSIRQRSSEETE